MDKFRIMQLAGMLTESELREAKEDFIANAMGDKIMATYDKDRSHKPKMSTALDIVQYISQQTIPTYIQWVMKQYVAGQFKIEDLGRIKGELETFNKVKPKLQNKDLNSYPNLKTLYDALQPFETVDVTSSRQQEKSIKSEGATKLIDTPNFKVIIPKTQEAACYYGKGTKWCTAADKDNQFDNYTKEDDLHIIIAGDRKFQLCMKEDQFKQEQDQDLERSDVEYLSGFPEYKNFLNMMIQKYYVE